MAKGFKHGAGGGTPLNFKIVGNPQPEDPKENTIWLNTDVKTGRWFFGASEPENSSEGMAWITTGISGFAEFNALKKNGITVCPMSAKQYIDGAWVDVTAQIYQGGAWIELIPNNYLYYCGTCLTEFETTFTDPNVGIVAYKDDHVLLSRTVATNSQLGWRTKEKIDLSKYSKLCVEVSNTTGGSGNWDFRFGAYTGAISGTPTNGMAAGTTFAAHTEKKVYEVQLSGNIASAYVGFQGCGNATVYRIWME